MEGRSSEQVSGPQAFYEEDDLKSQGSEECLRYADVGPIKWRERGTSRMAKRKAPEQHQSEAWNELPWRKLEKHVSRIQTRIYRAKQAGKTRAVHT